MHTYIHTYGSRPITSSTGRLEGSCTSLESIFRKVAVTLRVPNMGYLVRSTRRYWGCDERIFNSSLKPRAGTKGYTRQKERLQRSSVSSCTQCVCVCVYSSSFCAKQDSTGVNTLVKFQEKSERLNLLISQKV